MSALPPTVIVVMGVSGAGKTTIAKGLATALSWPFQEGDDLHPPENVAKMRAGIPLTDEDRLPWLGRVATTVDLWLGRAESGVITCSALKRAYRRIVIGDRKGVRLVCVTAPDNLIRSRIESRQHDYMPASLLDSQFEAFEMPGEDEHPIIADVSGPAAESVARIVRQLHEG